MAKITQNDCGVSGVLVPGKIVQRVVRVIYLMRQSQATKVTETWALGADHCDNKDLRAYHCNFRSKIEEINTKKPAQILTIFDALVAQSACDDSRMR